ncbi:MAG: hypothetical protein HKP26_05505 [Nitrosopumilus sp.]|nr:hypothetical protein [Nitrosopumilus sp.]
MKLGIIIAVILIGTIGIEESFAKESKIPNWILDVYEFWAEKKISDTELINAVKFLNEKSILPLVLQKEYDYKSNFLLAILHNDFVYEENSCYDGWYVTGYFTPVESDYSSYAIEIKIDDQFFEYDYDFVDSVKREGWGKTNNENYLGWYSNEFHLNEVPLDNFGNTLKVGTIAIDPSSYELGSKIFISSLIEPWNEIIFTANDVGESIKNKHIDVFTGEGIEAENETFRITSYNNLACFIDE